MHITEIEMDGKKLKNTHEEGTIFEIVLMILSPRARGEIKIEI